MEGTETKIQTPTVLSRLLPIERDLNICLIQSPEFTQIKDSEKRDVYRVPVKENCRHVHLWWERLPDGVDEDRYYKNWDEDDSCAYSVH